MTTDTLHHVILYGQSLAHGYGGGGANSTTALRAGRNFMFDAVRTLKTAHTSSDINTELLQANITAFSDLKEQVHSAAGETVASMLAYRLTESATTAYLPANEGVLVAAHSIGGQSYDSLKRGTEPYLNILRGVRRGSTIQTATGRIDTMGVVFEHGQEDRADTSTQYQTKLEELQPNLQEDLGAISHLYQGILPLFISQMASFTAYNLTESGVPLGQFQAALDNPDKIILSTPQYHLPYAADGVHLTKEGYAWLGSYYGEVMRRVFVLNQQWFPLHIESAVQSGADIVLTYRMPVNSTSYRTLTIDTTLVSDPGNRGFRLIDDGDGNFPTMTNFALAQNTPSNGFAQLTITFSAAPTGSNRKIGYADIGVSGNNAGPTTGARGCIRDSTPTTDFYSNHLYNWAVAQRIDVT